MEQVSGNAALPPATDLSDKVREWLFGGNVVAKTGLLILFMGLSFLLKYLAATYETPVEYRVAGVAACALALLAWGWKIRVTRPGISLPVQGTALAVLMLATFSTLRLHLLEPAVVFALLAVFVAFTCVLAVLQDAVWLAVFGIIGGFATPALVSTGGGNHVALFTWCAILNAGVMVIAACKSWRALNVLGFLCTFVLATAWGLDAYRPEHYLTSQLFLALFLLMYIAVAMFYARQQAPRLTHYVDGTLVFGAPLAAMGLQYGLVRDIHFGMAYSALAMGALYLLLAIFVKRRMGEHCRLLGEAFMALGIVSSTLAIPYGFDDRWTSAAWSLEAAGVIWAGLRQRRPLAWMFGLLVQVASWLSFLRAVGAMNEATIADAHMSIGFAILAIAAFFTALQLRAADAQTKTLSDMLLPIACAWLLSGAWLEIAVRTDSYTELNLLVASVLAVAALLYGVCLRWQWPAAGLLSQAVLLLGGAAFVLHTRLHWADDTGSFVNSAIPAALMLAASLTIVCERRHAANSRANSATGSTTTDHAMLLAAALAWLIVALPAFAAWAGGAIGTRLPEQTVPFSWSIYLLMVAALTTLALVLARRRDWPALYWLSASAFIAQVCAGIMALVQLYAGGEWPDPVQCTATLAAWAAAGYALQQWRRTGWLAAEPLQLLLHLQLVALPLLMVWPALHINLVALAGDDTVWSTYVPAWGTMAATAWLLHCAARNTWPLQPLSQWHRRVTLRAAVAGALMLATVWNFAFDGGMAPLPYVPVLNPLDLTTGFAALLALSYWRATDPDVKAIWAGRMQLAGAGAAWLWFNLMLLRTVSHYLDVAYTFDALKASLFTQAMLSLVWSGTALVLMRHAARHLQPRQWGVGAALLAVVLAKLFLHDLANRGGIEGIVSFIGVGLLTLAIGYAAPLPRRGANGAA